jgi:hypothetical protein
VDVSATGANHTWDFSQITPISQDTYKYTKPAGLYALTFFGDAALDLKIAAIKGAFSFFKTSTTDYQQQGMGITIPTLNLPTSLVFSAPDVIYRFPVKYGNIDSCTFRDSTSIIAGISITIKGKRVNTVDGWGKITTPYKTYDCIRIKSVVTETDNIGTAIDRSRIEYKWWATTEQIPVMQAVVTKNAMTGGSTMVVTYRDSYKNIVNPNAPLVDFDVKDTNIFINHDSLLFNNKTTKGFTYAWTITPNTYSYAAGTKNTTKNPQVIFHAVGLYTVTLASTGVGGTNTLSKKNYINATHNSGIKPVSENFRLHVYPNPASGGIFISANSNHSGLATITLSNIFGQTVLNKTVSANEVNTYMDINGIAPGVYLVKWQAGEESYMEKVVVR